VLMDVTMPVLTGTEATRLIRSQSLDSKNHHQQPEPP